MLTLNKEILFIRVNRFEYLLKKGTISNYSFTVIDEEKLGVLTILFEEISYPKTQEEIIKSVNYKGNFSTSKLVEIISQLIDAEILLLEEKTIETPLCIITPEKNKLQVEERFREIISNNFKIIELERIEYSEILEEVIVLFIPYYSPSVLHEIAEFGVKKSKKLFITYVDGDEGIIIPLMDLEGPCFNDYEIMRESSLYNLLDYKVMKEHLIYKESGVRIEMFKWEYILMTGLLILKQHLETSNINTFSYSVDTERFIITKSKLFRFPKNSLSQSDVNIKHPFI